MNNKLHILLVEDNRTLAGQLLDYLSQQGFVCDYAGCGKDALNLLDQHFDVVILDLNLPDMDGLEICEHIKTRSARAIPILMLTARDSLNEKSEGFAAGTDDYLVKPYAVEEVAMRCLALARREQLHRNHQIGIGDLVIDTQSHEVCREGQAVALSQTDFTILVELARAYPKAVSRNFLQSRLWGEDHPDSDVLRSHIYTLRQALDKPFEWPMIKTLHGVGFRLETKK